MNGVTFARTVSTTVKCVCVKHTLVPFCDRQPQVFTVQSLSHVTTSGCLRGATGHVSHYLCCFTDPLPPSHSWPVSTDLCMFL